MSKNTNLPQNANEGQSYAQEAAARGEKVDLSAIKSRQARDAAAAEAKRLEDQRRQEAANKKG